ncbi:MAG TPA: FAD-binding oxidoreductase [Candidatus Poseidoniales archaeon]|jgi:D-amino-acid oxidase|nr:MAG TPA: FAD-binding oxidoreductase [Candidatus Poseidoniales archaeon]
MVDVSVIGAGVSGLSTGIRLLEAGYNVRIFSQHSTPETVSDTAAAWWYPFLVEPLEKTNRWSAETFSELVRLSEEEGLSCITMRLGKEFLEQECEPPGWSNDIPHFRILEEDEIASGYSFGWEIEAPVIEMHLYMPWLERRFIELGGEMTTRYVQQISELPGHIVVNCCGLGGKELCDDHSLEPVRGQIVYTTQDPGFGRFDQRPESLIYTIPRRDVTVLGGTAQRGDWDENIRDEDTELILRKCETLWPELDRSMIVGVSVGLRPSRKEVRLEAEVISGRKVIHNYGHGGAGVTLSWGCADEVARMLSQ